MSEALIQVDNLSRYYQNHRAINQLSFTLKAGEVLGFLGPNGAGKSTMGYVMTGRDGYSVESGSVTVDGVVLLELEAEERARQGLFLAFQYPIEIPGISNATFLKTAVNEIRKYKGQEELSPKDIPPLKV